MSIEIIPGLNDRFRFNARRKRAEAVTARLFSEIKGWIPDRVRRDVFVTMLDTLMADGVEVITDDVRRAAGLPSRGPDGMTADDLRALEAARLKAIYAPIVFASGADFATAMRTAGDINPMVVTSFMPPEKKETTDADAG